ncbi:MAG: aldo/keto reductase [Candidatus Sericytochromatia bacterium]|nr:aldo/keto reductase [Candidatus Sericytochromatia bacterium]
MTTTLPTTGLGETGRLVTRVGLGGEGVLRTRGRAAEAQAVLTAALEAGITYFDCARAYADSERYHGALWGRRPAERERVFLTSKSAARDGGGARRELEDTLTRMGVEELDLWQIHDVRTAADLDELSHPGGALDTFVRAREQGLVRHIGVTGHHSPRVLLDALATWPLDTVLLPVNPMEALLGGFLTEVLRAARARGLGVIGMKALGGAGAVGGAGGGRLVQAGFEAQELLRFALAQPVDVVIVGCASPAEVQALVAASQLPPLTASEQAGLCARLERHVEALAGYRGDFSPLA